MADKSTLKTVIRHIALWCLYLFGSAFLYMQYDSEFSKELKAHLLYLPFVMASTYLTVYYLIPQFLLKKKNISFVILVIVSAFVLTVLERIAALYILLPRLYPQYVENFNIISIAIISTIIRNYFIVFMWASGVLFNYWYKNQTAKQELAQEKLKAELSFLRAQIHPHFLFNTLNNLYVLVKKKSESAPDLILRLSNILRYILYECNSDFVEIEKEIGIIQDYISIEKIRYTNGLQLSFETEGNFNGVKIAPIILLPFVENCFKHGVSNSIRDRWIKVLIRSEKEKLECIFQNSKESDAENTGSTLKNGIGLTNVKRRLDIIYKNRYRLETEDRNNSYSVKLTIDLNGKSDES